MTAVIGAAANLSDLKTGGDRCADVENNSSSRASIFYVFVNYDAYMEPKILSKTSHVLQREADLS